MTSGGYEVDPATLTQAASGINGVITELRDLGVVGTGDMGRGFSNMGLSGMDFGHEGLASASGTFLSRWAWGVRTLVQDGNEIGVRLNFNAGAYALMEEYASDSFKTMTLNLAGDPGISSEEAADMSWDDVGDNVSGTDYSAESWDEAGDRMGDSWEQTMEDTAQNGGGLLGRVQREVAPLPGQGGN